VTQAIAAEQARYDKIGSDATITWYGEYSAINRICLGDVQKAAERMLRYIMESDRMEALVADKLDEEYVAGSVTAIHGGIGAEEDYAPVVKSDILNLGIVAETITVDTAEAQTAAVKVQYKGEDALTSVRLNIASGLPIASIESANDFEYNPETGDIIVYSGAGEAIDNDLFTIIYEFDGLVADGEYPVDLTLIEVTADAEIVYAIAIDGAVIIDNTYAKGDVTQDGSVDNRDLIMIARYLVGLVEFNEKQLEAAELQR
jgi:hypothetical protein